VRPSAADCNGTQPALHDQSPALSPFPTTALLPSHPEDLLGFEKHSTARDFFHKTSYAIVAGVPLALICGGPVASVINVACGVVIPLHAHIGMRSVILDYVHVVPQQRVVLAGLAVFTAGSALGLTYFNLYDVGLTEGIKALWIKQHPM
jgi:succinate dehydrogenase hydrophobic anchor subunit